MISSVLADGGRRGVRVHDDMSSYAGDVEVRDAWQRLGDRPHAVLVDVRSRAEWTFVGVPDLTELGKEPLFIEWQSFPGMERNPGFVDALAEELGARGVGQDNELYFLCRSGGRSASAAKAMAAAGFTRSFNVAGGFEGNLDGDRHRGTVDGWKAAGLPWKQS